MKMEIIVIEAMATRLTNSCRGSGVRCPDNLRRTAGSFAAVAGFGSRHCTVAAGTAGRERPCLERLRRDERPVVDLPVRLPKAKHRPLAHLESRNDSLHSPLQLQSVSRSPLPPRPFL